MFRPNLDYHQGTLRDENHTATTLEFYNYSINLFDYLVLKKIISLRFVNRKQVNKKDEIIR